MTSGIFRKDDDSILWIGYADFLTTLVILFFVVAVVLAQGLGQPPRPGYVFGVALEAEQANPLEGCAITLGTDKSERTRRDGSFNFEVAGLTTGVRNSVDARCEGYARQIEMVDVFPGDTVVVRLSLTRDEQLNVTPVTLSGDALFASGSAALRPAAVQMIVDSVKALALSPSDLVVVTGHTDDVPFGKGSSRDNWVLSGERAAAAARVLTDPSFGIGLPPCQVSIMGFGPSRPVSSIDPGDMGLALEEKRARNRRIEFRRMSGAHLLSGECATQ